METKQKTLINYPTKDASKYMNEFKPKIICPYCQTTDKVKPFLDFKGNNRENKYICHGCIETFEVNKKYLL